MQYHNPVYPSSFPDPFVLKHAGVYWAYATGEWRDGRRFGVLRSDDLVRWEEVGGALEPLPEGWPHYWAPEVTYENGRFFMYYSAGDELSDMHVRVAVATSPAGPFVDSGRRLTREPFAIDAHVFVDDDGARHLFYATDYLEHSHVGTGTARDVLLDPLTPAGRPTPVTRARFDWQVYDPRRAEKGGVRWHTVEGPFVLKRKGRYYQMFSGGNWQNPTYGVSYATAERIDRPGEWDQHADGERVLPILRTVPGAVVGPGHNSAVRGPDNRQLFCVYHRWDTAAGQRVMAVDPLDWAGRELLLLGPTTTPQPMPMPTFADTFQRDEAGGLGGGWACRGGRWSARGLAYQESAEGEAAASAPATPLAGVACLLEVTLRALGQGGAYGVALGGQLEVTIEPGEPGEPGALVVAARRPSGAWERGEVPLPAGLDPLADHLLRVELNAGRASVSLDGGPASRGWAFGGAAGQPFALLTRGAAAAFQGFAVTDGWEDLFEEPLPPGQLGWRAESGCAPGEEASWQVAGQELVGSAGCLLKGPLPERFALAVGARVVDGDGGYAIFPSARAGSPGPSVALARAGASWALRCSDADGVRYAPLPEGFGPAAAQLLRLAADGGRIHVALGAAHVAELAPQPGADSVGIGAEHATVAFDMVRVTALA